jgi:hypothetical protein
MLLESLLEVEPELLELLEVVLELGGVLLELLEVVVDLPAQVVLGKLDKGRDPIKKTFASVLPGAILVQPDVAVATANAPIVDLVVMSLICFLPKTSTVCSF